MAKRKFTKTNEEIVTLVNSQVRNCANWSDSKLSQERERVQDYYNNTKPAASTKALALTFPRTFMTLWR